MEYAFEGYRAFTDKEIWSDSYKTLGDARRAAKAWVDKTPTKSAILLQKIPRPPHHEIGAHWAPVGFVKWTT